MWRHTRRGDRYVTVVIDLTPVRHRSGPARLLDMVPGRFRGATGLKGSRLGVHRLGRGPVPGVTACLGGRLALVVAQVLAQAKRPGPLSRASLTSAGSSPSAPVMFTCPAPGLLKQAVQSPSRAQLVDHIPPTSRRPVVIISSSHQCQSFHKGLHKPLNRLQVHPTHRGRPAHRCPGRAPGEPLR